MKKILLMGVVFLGSLFADNWGIIEAVNQEKKTIKVNKSIIKVLPYTKIEEETCMENGFYGMDIPRTFNDLKVGQAVELDFLGIENGILLAEEIEIKCARAY